MNVSGLSFNALPSIDIPFRYFLTAPVFVIICALFLMFNGELVWQTRWHPFTIMLTHGFTLGFIAMVMMGAILQMLPVLTGVGVKHVNIIGKVCHLLLTVGTALLMFGFAHPKPLYKTLALLLLSICFIVYIFSVGRVLVSKLSQGDTIIGMRFALIALLVTVVLGISLYLRLIGINLLPSGTQYTNLHLYWGLGWISLLVISVSFQVIPMFHVAPSFPKLLTKLLPAFLFISLTLLLLAKVSEPLLPSFVINISTLLSVFVLLLHGIFAVFMLQTLNQRKRKVPDTTINFWQLCAIGMFVLLGSIFFPSDLMPAEIQLKLEMFQGATFIYFFAMSVILGMLLKIIPFLSYTHLQQQCMTNFSAMAYLPNMHDFINKKQGNTLFLMHIATGVSLMISIAAPRYHMSFSVLLMIEFLWLLYLMVKSCRTYHSTAKLMQSLPAQP